jgi:isoleucyl-tRNA synthetase
MLCAAVLLCPCRYGVWGDWDRPYITLQPEYEAAQLRVFGDMFLKGHIYR